MNSHSVSTYKDKFLYILPFEISQDGVRWMDLQDISEETYNSCKSIRGCFTGEPSHIYPLSIKAPPSESKVPYNACILNKLGI